MDIGYIRVAYWSPKTRLSAPGLKGSLSALLRSSEGACGHIGWKTPLAMVIPSVAGNITSLSLSNPQLVMFRA